MSATTTEVEKIDSVRSFFERIVLPDYDEFTSNPTSLRKAFHCAGSLFHMHDWIFTQHRAAFSRFGRAEEYSAELAANDENFRLIRDVANAGKHMELTRGNPTFMHSANVALHSVGYGDSYGSNYGGGEQIRIHIGPTEYRDFLPIAKAVVKMWKSLFDQNGW